MRGERPDALVGLLRAHAGGRFVEKQHAPPSSQHYASSTSFWAVWLISPAIARDVVQCEVIDRRPNAGARARSNC
jgi:hypothetical protein